MDLKKEEVFSPEGRVLTLGTNVSEEAVQELIKQIHIINKYDYLAYNEKREYNPSPIELIINTPGGLVYDGFGLIDAIETSETPVFTIVKGKAMSMGFAIALAGHRRFATRHSRFMFHQVAYGNWGMLQSHKEQVAEADHLWKMMKDYVAEKGVKLPEDIAKKVEESKYDWFLSAEEAKEYGIIDEIIMPVKHEFEEVEDVVHTELSEVEKSAILTDIVMKVKDTIKKKESEKGTSDLIAGTFLVDQYGFLLVSQKKDGRFCQLYQLCH